MKTELFHFDFDRSYNDEAAIPNNMTYYFTVYGEDSLFTSDLTCSDEWLEFVSEMEIYGVHDTGYSPDYELAGYHTYEVTQENELIVVNKWRDYLMSLGFICGDTKTCDDADYESIMIST